jgi:hypothetical protein
MRTQCPITRVSVSFPVPAETSHEFLGQRTLGTPDSQAMWRRIFLAELDPIFAH